MSRLNAVTLAGGPTGPIEKSLDDTRDKGENDKFVDSWFPRKLFR